MTIIKSVWETRFETLYGFTPDREVYTAAYRGSGHQKVNCGRRTTSFQFTDLYSQK